jgi:uncharacterized membrane protein YagU involved in acid resistance
MSGKLTGSGLSSDSSFRRLFQGAAAGFVATAPMTVAMLLGWMLLPRHEKYPLPPREITEEIAERAGIEDQVSEAELVAASLASHFAYGALNGAGYGLIQQNVPLPASIKGMLAGLAIWAGSYLGWLPALALLRPATQHPWRRNLLMIIAHIIWGATVGEITRKLTEQSYK